MSLLRNIATGLRSLFRKEQVDRELNEELGSYLEMAADEKIKQGMTRKQALRAVRLERGSIDAAKEVVRSAGWEFFVETCWQDLRFAARMLRKNPTFTVVAVLTLGLGIGANTAVFTVVNGVLLRPMPFPEPQRLFLVSLTPRSGPFVWQPGVADSDYLAFRDQDQAFENIASFTKGTTASLTGAGEAAQIPVAYVTTGFFATLRTNPEIGRGFLEGEDESGHDNVAVLSNELWKQRFGSDDKILGKTIRLDGVGRTIIGIMPPGFAFPDAKVWMPLGIRIGHNSFTRPVVGRLKAGVSPQQAQAELETFAERLPLDPGESKTDRMPQIIPLKDLLVANIRPMLLVFAGAVTFVLLIACANVANLFLARAAGRGQEMAVRSTLGANRWRLVRQLLAESTVVSLAGGAAGILLAFWGVPALIALAPAGKIPRMEMIRIDGCVLAFTFGLSVITGLVFGLAPAFRATRHAALESLSEAGRGVTTSHEGIRGVLTISEIAVALILLTGAGLMLKSFLLLRNVNPGFVAHSVMTMTVDLPDSTYRTTSQMQAFDTRTIAGLSRLPGIVVAAAVDWMPLSGALAMGTFQVEGGRRPRGFMVDKPCISSGYFRAMGIRLMRGREFTEGDNATAPGVVVVSQSVARTLWPGQDPLGKRISMEDDPKPGDWLTVVGVVDDIKQQGLAKNSDPAIYQPYLQVSNSGFLSHMTFVVRTASRPESVAAGMRTILQEVDKNQPMSISSMESLIATTTAESRFQMRLLATFALTALALTIVGVYGVLAYSVAQRTREIGVRMAFGAQGIDVLRMFVRKALLLISAGIVIGGAGAFALTRLLATFLFEVKSNDLPTFAAVALALAFSALTACYIPARRAMRVDPMVALRYE
ncbi:MAG TPA: ABC transporter permease [Candidatus Acidoferrum sp.]|jgi:putative ABC transport system permease protein